MIVTKIAVSSSHSLRSGASVSCGKDAGLDQKLEPIRRLFDLAEAITALGNKFRFASTAERLPIVCANRSA